MGAIFDILKVLAIINIVFAGIVYGALRIFPPDTVKFAIYWVGAVSGVIVIGFWIWWSRVTCQHSAVTDTDAPTAKSE